MTQFATATRFQPVREVEAYWDALRAGRLVPRRSDIDPRGIERALEFAFVLERIAPGLGRLRIAGSHLTELMGMEVRGMPLSALISADSRNAMSDALEEVFAGPSKVELVLRSDKAIGKPALEARMVLLPLKSDLGDITRVLGCLVASGQTGRAPRRFDIVDTEITPLLGDARVFDQEVPDVVPSPAPSRPVGMAESQTRFEPGPAPYLRLVKTDHSE
ncbi:PAS domain-containing protein [Pseudooceanicola onchidii]|uniref:PAS domain-containing protein n=1 Tax=Pseudooceanicola onchidii TaxID=2562279 RepID=UPI001F0EB1F6|nr:PAS domain-containing protein [Pseudooceanicola onchidii]